ncbi:MAG: orotate phosphoribosyltransferase [Rhodospirillaceae bacterium]
MTIAPADRDDTALAAGRTVARLLLDIGAVNFRPQEPYTLTAGWASPVYIDCRKVIAYPQARRRITALAVERIEAEIGFDKLDTVAGGETAGIPYAAWIAEALALPMQYVRKKPKGFGRMAQIEGDLREGSRTLLVEDLATDGGSKITFVEALRTAGAQVSDTFVVFFYGAFPGAIDTLDQAGVNLRYLCTWWDVLEEAEARMAFPPDALEGVRDFLHDPVGWSASKGGRDS